MAANKFKIHVIGINSFELKDLSPRLQQLILNTVNIAIPNSYFSNIKKHKNPNYSLMGARFQFQDDNKE